MKIGELAQLSGFAASRIRFYEAQGLIHQVHRRTNGYREYPPQVLRTLEIIQCAQQAGFSLQELKQLLPAGGQGDWKQDEMLASLESKVEQIEEMQQHLAQSKAKLLGIINTIKLRPDGMPCGENAERVLASIKGNR
jgi:DNA-binding transcriptional MerR regulator